MKRLLVVVLMTLLLTACDNTVSNTTPNTEDTIGQLIPSIRMQDGQMHMGIDMGGGITIDPMTGGIGFGF